MNSEQPTKETVENAGKQICELVVRHAHLLTKELTEQMHKELQLFLDDVKDVYTTTEGEEDVVLKKRMQHIVAIGVLLEILAQQREMHFKELNEYLFPPVEIPSDKIN